MATAEAEQPAVTSLRKQPVSTTSPAGLAWSALAGVAAAWTAAGSTGLLAHPLNHAITCLFLVGSVVCGYSPGPWTLQRLARWAAATAVILLMAASASDVINILACACVPAALALERKEHEQAPLLDASRSIGFFVLYRFALVSVPWFWSVADHTGAFIAAVAGAISPHAFAAGATFAGLDFLVLNGALFGCRIMREPAPRRRAVWRWGLIVVAVHVLYLFAAAEFPRWIAWLIPAPAAPADGAAAAGGHGPAGLEAMLLWNLPALGMGMHLALTAGLLLGIRRVAMTPSTQAPSLQSGWWCNVWQGKIGWASAVGLAVLVPALAVLNVRPLSLQGKTIVVHEKGFLNWLKPKHGDYGRLSVGMYGMLPEFLQSYGARCVISPDLSENDLRGADLVMLIYPNKSWEEGQRERLWRFVRQGGALLVLGEHTVREKDGGSRFNEVLEPTAMRVAFDSGMFAIGGWLHSYEVMAHPAASGLRDDRNQFGVVIGASVEARWPARPLLVGRWGWADPGDASNNEARGSSMMGNQRYDAGEKVGDVLLAAEQPLGKGRVVVFGDTSGFTNGILFGSHQYAAALFASMCQGIGFGPARGLAALLGLMALGFGLWRMDRGLLPMATAFALSLTLVTAWSRSAADLTPTGANRTPNNLAYIDSTHLERSSGESWRINGLGGLELTLMRNNYLVMSLPEFTSERLQRAGLLISAAPARPFSRTERTRLRQYIENGGIFICMVGYPESGASRQMLAEFGFFVGGRGAVEGVGPEPKPFGHFKAPFHNAGSYMNYVRFHAAWPVESSDPQAIPLAYGPRDPQMPAGQKDPAVILMRRIGRGKMLVVADSDFATNQNLEREGGQPFEGLRENAHFWRWLLTYVNEQPIWTPPKPDPETPATPVAPAAPVPTNAPPPLLQRLPEESLP